MKPFLLFCAWAVGLTLPATAQPAVSSATVNADFSGFRTEAGAKAMQREGHLIVQWPAGAGRLAELQLDLGTADKTPLIARLALDDRTVLERVDPVTFLTVGERDLKAPAGWMAFFDNPPLRSHQTYAAELKKRTARITSVGSRTIVSLGDVTAGPFTGRLELTLFHGSPLVFAETVLMTEEDGRAIVYDAGLVSPGPGGRLAPWTDANATTYSPLAPGAGWRGVVWLDADGKLQRAPAKLNEVIAPLKVSRRTLVAEGATGAIAVFPPPHQYFYPLDFANNLGFAWHGVSRNPLMSGYGFGIRQPREGDRIWVPWVNAPPRTEQRLGAFYLFAADAERALEDVGQFTRGDRYKRIEGHRTFTSHYHIEHTLELAKARLDQQTGGIPPDLEQPGFVKTFKARGVDIVHLAEFHVGAMPRMPARERLQLLKTLFDECVRLSDTELLVLPGEEPNVHLGGHWMSLFPKPVYWVLNRAPGEPFLEDVPGYGPVYRVGSAADVLELMQRENGLMWTAHARIKGSREFPDAYWEKEFYRSDRFLGAAWKAMPADLSQPRLGKRVLDLLDDMANAGLRKYVLAEADLFRMEPDYESYAHMNINYLALEKVPPFTDGWKPVLDALHQGKFFATTGEVLVPHFTVGGARSGDVLRLAAEQAGAVRIEAWLEWTFPLAFAELVFGDGNEVHRQRIELPDTEAFGDRRLEVDVDLRGFTWARLEVWDVARNGAFTPPVWLEQN